jgi:hypothetical protein
MSVGLRAGHLRARDQHIPASPTPAESRVIDTW